MKPVYVAAGVVLDDDSKVLISRRLAHQHQGGKWEFPGGKVESGETAHQALKRELAEEVNIQIQHCEWFETIEFDYPDKSVRLDFLIARGISGEAKGLEGQEVRWVDIEQLTSYEFPEANKKIVEKLQREYLS